MAYPVKPAPDLITVDEFYRLVPDGRKADLLDGVIFMASPDSLRSNELTGFIEYLLRGFVDARNLSGRVFASRFAFRLSPLRAPEPDVAYVGPARLHLVGETGMDGGPDVAVEVVSLESRDRDYTDKKQIYQDAGVTEYWIVDPLEQRVEFHRLQDDRYELVPLENDHVFRSAVIPEFWIDVDWLLAVPLPNVYDCLQRLLGDDPNR